MSKHPLVALNVRISVEMKEALETLAKREKVQVSDLVREALASLLKDSK
jgi:predicted DNA-binding protein